VSASHSGSQISAAAAAAAAIAFAIAAGPKKLDADGRIVKRHAVSSPEARPQKSSKHLPASATPAASAVFEEPQTLLGKLAPGVRTLFAVFG
jgi:hypothetical protein